MTEANCEHLLDCNTCIKNTNCVWCLNYTNETSSSPFCIKGNLLGNPYCEDFYWFQCNGKKVYFYFLPFLFKMKKN